MSGGGDGGVGGGGDGGNMKRGPQSAQSVAKAHWTGAPKRAVSERSPPSWHAPLEAWAHVSSHHIGGGGRDGGVGGGGGAEHVETEPDTSVRVVAKVHTDEPLRTYMLGPLLAVLLWIWQLARRAVAE